MNILIPHEWLLEHLETKATPVEIQKYLSLCGPSVERIYEREGEPVYDIEVTTNRVDSMSVRGIAREAAVILNQFGIATKFKPFRSQPITFNARTAARKLKAPTVVHHDQLCPRIVWVALADVQRAATPKWMAKRLRQVELNVHDAVIDITNYVTHELGHPCHAFDYDKIMELGGSIIITEAAAGKEFQTLDGNTYTTVGGELVFENDQGVIIDLPGIKGTSNTAIQPDTKNVLFWVEDVVPEKIRFGSMTHAIRTVAAQLNEKNVDPHLSLSVLEEGTKLFQTLCGATVASPVYDHFPAPVTPPAVTVSQERISEYLGIELPIKKVEQILRQLGCELSLAKGIFTVQPPTFRPDITIAADVIEEIARIYGYHNLPSVLMPTAIPLTKPVGTDFAAETKVKRFLAAIGWQEVYTYSLVSAELAQQTELPLLDHLRLQNPLTDDRVYLRRSLVPSLVELIQQNPQAPQLSVFELANVYTPRPGQLPQEELHLTLVSRRPQAVVKGELEALASSLFITGWQYRQEADHTGQILATTAAGATQVIGRLQLLPAELVSVDLTWTNLLAVSRRYPQYRPLLRTTPIIEDLTFTVPARTLTGEVIHAMQAVSPLVQQVRYLNHYQHNLSLRISYQDPEQQLNETAVSQVRQAVIAAVKRQFHGQLVGTS